MSKSKVQAKGFKDNNLAAMDPLKAQEMFKPTDANPIRMHAQMAGDPVDENIFRSPAEKKVDAIYGKKAAPAPQPTETADQKLARKVDEAGG